MSEIDSPIANTQAPTIDWAETQAQMPDPSSLSDRRTVAVPTSEKEHHLFVRKYFHRYGVAFIGVEHDFIHWLRRAEKLVCTLAVNNDEPFIATHYRWGRTFYKLTRVGNSLVNVLRSYNGDTVKHYRHHRFNPPLTVILTVAAKYSPKLVSEAIQNGTLTLGEQGTRDILTTAADAIRSKCHSQKYKDEVDNYRRNEEKNIVSCCEYMAAQFRRRSKLLILRIDLYFRRPHKAWGYTKEADQHHARFLRALRENRIVPDVLGYISKREDGIDRGIHYHVLIVIDGHEHRDAANLTRTVGEDWERRCGKGDFDDCFAVGEATRRNKASYFNCYTRVNHYQFNGLGLIHPTDTDKLRGLRAAIEYMCKETSQLRPSCGDCDGANEGAATAISSASRNLRKGIMPKGHSGRGAPRSSGLDTSTIDQELLKKRP